MRPKRPLSAASVRGRRVLVRVDFNVPLTPSGTIADDRRIQEALPTLRHLQAAGARSILLSHLGRPDGRRDPHLSLRPIAHRLSGFLGQNVPMAEDAVGMRALEATARLQNGDFLLLENLRFHAGEESNDPAFAAQLAQLGELFVEEAFGTVHRAHASTVGVPKHLPGYVGLLVEKEIRALSRLVDGIERPYAAVLGGAKVADKLPFLESFLGRADALLVGGALAFPFLKARGADLGASPVEEGLEENVRTFLATAERRGTRVLFPTDWVVAAPDGGEPAVAPVDRVPGGTAALDIGPETRAEFSKALLGAKTVFWNGPLGKAEDLRFAEGTRTVLSVLRAVEGFRVAAGGDSARVAQDLGALNAFDFVSTGGGAALEFVQGLELPGLAAIADA